MASVLYNEKKKPPGALMEASMCIKFFFTSTTKKIARKISVLCVVVRVFLGGCL